MDNLEKAFDILYKHKVLASEVKMMPEEKALEIIDNYMINHKEQLTTLEIVAFNKARIALEKDMKEEDINGRQQQKERNQ